MADQSMMQKLAAALTGGAKGLAGYANPGYAMYVREMQAQGQSPLPEAQWASAQQQPQPQVAQQEQPAAPAQPFRF